MLSGSAPVFWWFFYEAFYSNEAFVLQSCWCLCWFSFYSAIKWSEGFGLRTPSSLCAQAGKCNLPNMTTLSVMSLDISRTFPTFTLRVLPLCGCDFCIKQQETLRHRCDPSLECYHGNRSRVWWTAEFGTLDLKVVQAVPSPGASHAH